jgi:hypothetical protein
VKIYKPENIQSFAKNAPAISSLKGPVKTSWLGNPKKSLPVKYWNKRSIEINIIKNKDIFCK